MISWLIAGVAFNKMFCATPHVWYVQILQDVACPVAAGTTTETGSTLCPLSNRTHKICRGKNLKPQRWTKNRMTMAPRGIGKGKQNLLLANDQIRLNLRDLQCPRSLANLRSYCFAMPSFWPVSMKRHMAVVICHDPCTCGA
jgi:hypothetical protein